MAGSAILLVVFLCAGMPQAKAFGEHGRRFATELAVMLGDVGKLLDTATEPLHRRGLEMRLEGSLNLLGLLARQQARERGADAAPLLTRIAGLREHFESREVTRMERELQLLVEDHPLHLPEWRDPEATSARLGLGRAIYERLCLGCHHFPDLEQKNPPYNLFNQARSEPRGEFSARLQGGVRGAPATSLDNPLDREELTSLLVWFLHAPPEQTGAARRHAP